MHRHRGQKRGTEDSFQWAKIETISQVVYVFTGINTCQFKGQLITKLF